MNDELDNFHWDPDKLGEPLPHAKPVEGLYERHRSGKKESWQERVSRMLMYMHGTVINCTMCSLGRQICEERHTYFDPHVFSNMIPSKWMIVGQKPFVGDAGKYFDRQLLRFGSSRNNFYISNAVKCHTLNNGKPTFRHVEACEPILRMELMLLKPKLVITLGAVAFGIFCPKHKYGDCLGKIIKSEDFGVNVFPLYHPSPRNINLEERRIKFEKDLKLLCKLIRAYRTK
jgi:uracil-DNA glycosylase family 4